MGGYGHDSDGGTEGFAEYRGWYVGGMEGKDK